MVTPHWTLAALLLISLFLGPCRALVYCGVGERSVCSDLPTCLDYDNTGDDECEYSQICCHFYTYKPKPNGNVYVRYPIIE